MKRIIDLQAIDEHGREIPGKPRPEDLIGVMELAQRVGWAHEASRVPGTPPIERIRLNDPARVGHHRDYLVRFAEVEDDFDLTDWNLDERYILSIILNPAPDATPCPGSLVIHQDGRPECHDGDCLWARTTPAVGAAGRIHLDAAISKCPAPEGSAMVRTCQRCSTRAS